MEAPVLQPDATSRGRNEFVTLIALAVLGLVLALPFRTGLVPALLCALTFRNVGWATRGPIAVLCIGIMAFSFVTA